MSKTNIPTLAIEANKNATKKGFWRECDEVIAEMKLDGKSPESIESVLRAYKIQMINFAIGELSEATEAIRENKIYNNAPEIGIEGYVIPDSEFKSTVKDTLEDELGDAIIRILDFCGKFDINIMWHILAKMNYNSGRPYLHGKKC